MVTNTVYDTVLVLDSVLVWRTFVILGTTEATENLTSNGVDSVITYVVFSVETTIDTVVGGHSVEVVLDSHKVLVSLKDNTNSFVKYTQEYSNDIKEGLYSEYNSTGEIDSLGCYKEGVFNTIVECLSDGDSISDLNGQLYLSYEYNLSGLYGVISRYSFNTTTNILYVSKIEEYINGKKEGIEAVITINRTHKSIQEYKAGLRHGISYLRVLNGIDEFTCSVLGKEQMDFYPCLIEGVVDSGVNLRDTLKYKNVKMLSYGYTNGALDGLFNRYYFGGGELHTRHCYEDGVNHQAILSTSLNGLNEGDGVDTLKYEDGRIEITFEYKDGLLHGLYSKYKHNSANRIVTISTYKNGALHGLSFQSNNELFCYQNNNSSESDIILCLNGRSEGNGTDTIYHLISGNLLYIYEYQNDNLHSLLITYYRSSGVSAFSLKCYINGTYQSSATGEEKTAYVGGDETAFTCP